MSVGIVQIYFDEGSKKNISTCVVPYDNSDKRDQPAFENHVIAEVVPTWAAAFDYFGVVSHKFEKKNQYYLCTAKELIEKEKQYDVYSFFGHHKNRNMWELAARWHKGINEVANYILAKIGYPIDVMTISTPTILQNAFICRSRIYKEYVERMLIPALAIMNEESIRDKLFIDSKYEYRKLQSDQHYRNSIMKMTGVNYVPYHTFLCERLFATWLYLNPHLTLKHLA